jgi:hypothetical protein
VVLMHVLPPEKSEIGYKVFESEAGNGMAELGALDRSLATTCDLLLVPGKRSWLPRKDPNDNYVCRSSFGATMGRFSTVSRWTSFSISWKRL